MIYIIPSQARWFILPGIYYNDDYGVIGTCSVIQENARGQRMCVQMEYFGDEQGQAGINFFYPQGKMEWTINARYQVSDQDAYSLQFPADQKAVVSDLRYYTDLWIRSDFLQKSGFFYGVQASYQSFEFQLGSRDLFFQNMNPAVIETFTEGEEITASLRIGVERRDNRYNSLRGYYFLWQLDAGRSISADQSKPLLRAQIDFRRYIPLTENWTVLALNFRSGIIYDEVPYFSLFKLGGSFSLRGFPTNRYYGNGFYLTRTEIRQILKDDLKLPLKFLQKKESETKGSSCSLGFVLFTDMGDLYHQDYGWVGFRQGIGAGLRAVLPPNVVASVDVAKPTDSSYFAFYLNLQQSF